MPTTYLGNEIISYVERGSGDVPVVFIHGAGSSHLIWGAQVRALGDMVRTIALDLPGHHKSQGSGSMTPAPQPPRGASVPRSPVGRDSITAYADVVRGFLDALAIPRAILVGHSMGGAIAQTFALAYPHRVAALALVATGARLQVSPAILDGFRDDFDATVDQISAHYFASGADGRTVAKSAALLRACGQRVVLGDFSACHTFDLTERITQIRAPTLVLCGRDDAMTPPKYSEFLAAKIPNAQLTLIDRAGHHVMIEQPEAVNRAFMNWMQNL